MPLDPGEVPAGVRAVALHEPTGRCVVVSREDLAERVGYWQDRGDVSFRASHWETCPSRERHRVPAAQVSMFDHDGEG